MQNWNEISYFSVKLRIFPANLFLNFAKNIKKN